MINKTKSPPILKARSGVYLSVVVQCFPKQSKYSHWDGRNACLPHSQMKRRVKVPGNFKAMFCPDQPNPWRRNQRYGPLSHCMRPMKDNHSWLAIYQNRAPWVGQLSRTPPRNWLVRQIFGIWEGRGAGIQDIAGGEKGLIGEHVHTCGIMITTVVIMVIV